MLTNCKNQADKITFCNDTVEIIHFWIFEQKIKPDINPVLYISKIVDVIQDFAGKSAGV